MSIFLAILSIALGVVAVLAAVVMPVSALLEGRRLVLRNEDRGVSTTPIMGSVLGFLAVLLFPTSTLSRRLAWSWVPLAIEIMVLGVCLGFWKLSGLGKEAERSEGSGNLGSHERRGTCLRRGPR